VYFVPLHRIGSFGHIGRDGDESGPPEYFWQDINKIAQIYDRAYAQVRIMSTKKRGENSGVIPCGSQEDDGIERPAA
jgi:hypothetical protein